MSRTRTRRERSYEGTPQTPTPGRRGLGGVPLLGDWRKSESPGSAPTCSPSTRCATSASSRRPVRPYAPRWPPSPNTAAPARPRPGRNSGCSTPCCRADRAHTPAPRGFRLLDAPRRVLTRHPRHPVRGSDEEAVRGTGHAGCQTVEVQTARDTERDTDCYPPPHTVKVGPSAGAVAPPTPLDGVAGGLLARPDHPSGRAAPPTGGDGQQHGTGSGRRCVGLLPTRQCPRWSAPMWRAPATATSPRPCASARDGQTRYAPPSRPTGPARTG